MVLILVKKRGRWFDRRLERHVGQVVLLRRWHFLLLHLRSLGCHLDPAMEVVVAADGQRVSLRVQDPLIQGDEIVIAEQEVQVLERNTKGPLRTGRPSIEEFQQDTLERKKRVVRRLLVITVIVYLLAVVAFLVINSVRNHKLYYFGGLFIFALL